ncbi:LamG domain-containing protein [Candidatus Marithrix sp. Canyon 246]|uniref:LamG domain-containing protein n=1 Tax=Candidatus Marithrix sp. Canyon 246 TaxID=1827136 RepID=UPI00084A09EA|nr:LamG domain-containing protein [Candidatus Marithrix sp. Canyon 246]
MKRLKCCLRAVLLIAIGFSLIPVVWADLSDGLVAYYPFDGNANDESGNGNHGTVHGATLIRDRNGNAENGYSFNGKKDYIHLSSLDSIGFKNGTVTLWFKLATGFHTGNKAINLFSKDNQAHEQNVIEAYFDRNTGKIKLDYGDFGQSIFSDSDSWDYQWYHFAFKWGNIGLKMYVNGIKQTDTLDIVSPVNADTITHIGTHQAVTNFFKGDIDDIRIYNRALSDSEIQQLYQPCQPSIDIKLNSNNRVTGDRVVINTHIKGPSISDSSCLQTKVELKFWATLPNNSVISLIKPFTMLSLLPGYDANSKIFEYTFGGAEPIGSYEINGRLLHTFSGETISSDIEVLTFSK